jgi:autoinducer 2-degrading protein
MERHQGSEWTARYINAALVQVYRGESAPVEHKKTSHYQAWRDTVAEMMAEPRSSVKYDNVFPEDEGWE